MEIIKLKKGNQERLIKKGGEKYYLLAGYKIVEDTSKDTKKSEKIEKKDTSKDTKKIDENEANTEE